MLSGRTWAAALAGVGLLAFAGSTRAGDDLMTLKGDAGGAVTMTLGSTGHDADTELVAHRGGGGGGGYRGGYGGGYRGGYGGYRGGYYGGYRGGYAGYRGGYYGGFYRGGYGGYYRPFYAGYYPWYYGGYYPAYYGSYDYPTYYSSYYVAPQVYPTYSYYPISNTGPASTTYITTPSNPNPYERLPRPQVPPMPPVENIGPGNFSYDGGPQVPVPMPNSNFNPAPAPTKTPAATVPLEGRLVALPARTTNPTPRPTYPAYGESGSTFATDRVAPTPTQVVQKNGNR
jgi:hypothetical protein